MKKDLLLEIGVEEIPALFINPALKFISEYVKNKFIKERICFKDINFYATPRRFVIYATNVENYTEDEIIEIQGPSKETSFTADGKPTPQAVGFAKKYNVKIEELIVKNNNKGDYLFAVKKKDGMEIEKVLPSVFTNIISSLKFPKSMKWEMTGFKFARPIRWLLALYGRTIIKFSIADVKSSNFTYLGPSTMFKKLKVLTAERYDTLIENNGIIIDVAKRKETIKKIILHLEKRTGNKVNQNEQLLDTITNLIEYPTLIHGDFDPEYLNLPAILIETTLAYHTKLFPVYDKSGKILNSFVGIRNGISINSEEVKQGYERVVRARLSDAKYFYEKDILIKLADRKEELKTVKYIENFGSLFEKQERIKKIINILSNIFALNNDIKKELFDATDILKADLVTEIVREFPELQGKMGKEIAKLQGFSENVCNAIKEQYAITGFEDIVPESMVSIIISLADKVDSLLCVFSAGFVPTGEQDPYGVRRIANGLIKIMYEKDININLSKLIEIGYIESFHQNQQIKNINQKVIEYIKSRVVNYLIFLGFPKEIIEAVTDDWDNFSDLKKRLLLIDKNKDNKEFLELVAIFKRINNILRQSKADYQFLETVEFKVDAFENEIEKKLMDYLINELEPLLTEEKYDKILEKTNDINKIIITFFESVKVMDENIDKKNNRLKILYKLHKIYQKIANFNKIISG